MIHVRCHVLCIYRKNIVLHKFFLLQFDQNYFLLLKIDLLIVIQFITLVIKPIYVTVRFFPELLYVMILSHDISSKIWSAHRGLVLEGCNNIK